MEYIIGCALGWLAFGCAYLVAVLADLFTWLNRPEKLSKEKTEELRRVLSE